MRIKEFKLNHDDKEKPCNSLCMNITLRVQVPDSYILTPSLHNRYYPSPKYPVGGKLEFQLPCCSWERKNVTKW